MMSRFVWSFAGLVISAGLMEAAFEGPRGTLISADPTAWTVVFMLGALSWLWLAFRAWRGRF